jgi:hypothetical protein
MRTRAAAIAFVLLSAAPGGHAAEARPYWNAQWGQPQKASAGLGLLLGRISGEDLQFASRAALVELRPGLGGGTLHVGYAPLAMKSRAFAFGGAAVKGTLLRTWGTPGAGLEPRATYAGAELHLAWILKGSVGALWKVSGPGRKTHVLTWSVGLGL